MKPDWWKLCSCGHSFMLHDGDGDDEALSCCVGGCVCGPTSAGWPDVPECQGHNGHASCNQCDGSHEHQWKASGRAVRCRICGGRKCDRPACISRRHHRDHHILLTGSTEPVGGLP